MLSIHILYRGAARLALISAALLPLAACDNIDEKDRLIPVEREHSDKVVLLEEFTGARCVNCPDGAAKVHSILESEAFKGKVIAVSLYPEQMVQLTLPITTDLRTPEATEYFSAYDGPSKGLPCAMFDRTPFAGSVLQLDVNQWPTRVDEALKTYATPTPVPVTISMTSDFNAGDRKLEVAYTVNYVDPIAQEVSFQLWALESGIISRQSSTTGIIREYENNHVLRTALNGTWGESLGAVHGVGDKSTGTASITLPENWKPENMHVVGFLFYTHDRRVIQAHQIPLLNSSI